MSDASYPDGMSHTRIGLNPEKKVGKPELRSTPFDLDQVAAWG